MAAPRTAVAATSETEVEPNNSCQSAQDLGALTSPIAIAGNLDASDPPDIDFFRFTATPGTIVTLLHEGQATGKGTLNDPLLGLFDSSCNLITYNNDATTSNAALEIMVPDNGILVAAATSYPDFGFTGGDPGSYQLTLFPEQHIGSISGILTDALTGRTLSGYPVAPFAQVYLYRNSIYGPEFMNWQNAGSDGSFRFETDSNGRPLRVGDYIITAFAEQYQTTTTPLFNVGESENYNAGRIALTSDLIRFSDLQPCVVPAQGGQCDFSVKITNGLPGRFSGQAWSMVRGDGIGSFISFTNFQTDPPREVNLDGGRSMILRFRFQVRGSVANGAYVCATAFVGQNPAPLFNTVATRFLFCFVKGDTGFTLLSEQQMQQQLLQMQIQEAIPANR
jgi:hypothetical protein